MRLAIHLAVVLVAASLTGCGSKGLLTSRSTSQVAQIKEFSQVVVLDFHANDMRPTIDLAERAQREQNINLGRILFADRVAERITETGAFTTVSRTPLPGRFLAVTGTVDVWEPGNVAARALTGFVGKSQFASTIQLLDGQTAEELARINGDRNSWPLPVGASTTILQTVDFFMNEAASHVALQLAEAKTSVAAAASAQRPPQSLLVTGRIVGQ